MTGADDVLGNGGNVLQLHCRLVRLRDVRIHLITIEICIVRASDEHVQTESLVGENLDPMRHHRHFVQRRLPVDQERVARAKMAPDLLARARRPTGTTKGHARDRSVHGLLTPERTTTAAVDHRTQPRQVAHRGEEGAFGTGTGKNITAALARHLRRRR